MTQDISSALKQAIDVLAPDVQRAMFLLLDELEDRERQLTETIESKPSTTRVVTNDHVKLRHEYDSLLTKVATIERERDSYKKSVEKEKTDRQKAQGQYDELSKLFKKVQKDCDKYKALYEEAEEQVMELRKSFAKLQRGHGR